MSNKALEVKDIHFSYGETAILKNINFSLNPSESLSLIGVSGCGKSTLLNLIAEDFQASSGEIKKFGLWRRVHQSHALLPWLTAKENILLGLRGMDLSKSLNFSELCSTLDITESLELYPRQLSGGLQQRVEIARALIGKPDGLLLDEPFSSLDYLIRREIREYLKKLLQNYPISLILVTHDIPEAIALTQRTLILSSNPATVTAEYDNSNPSGALAEKIWNDLKTKRKN